MKKISLSRVNCCFKKNQKNTNVLIFRYVIVFLIVFFNRFVYAQTIEINATDYQQTIDMVGGDMERSSLAIQSSVLNKDDVINWGFGDINFNFSRVQYDKKQELVEGVKNWSFYDRQVTTMQEVKAVNPDIKFYATLRSDYDGFGNNNNMPDWIVNYNTKAVEADKYAIFLADYLEFMSDNSVPIHTLSIAKEWISFVPANIAVQIIEKLNNEITDRNIPRPQIIDQGSWSISAGINYIDDVSTLGTKDLYQAFSSHDYAGQGEDLWDDIIALGNSLGKKVYDDETSTGGGPTAGVEVDVPLGQYGKRAVAYEAGLSGEIFFEIWSRGLNNETRAIYWPWGGTARRLRAYYIMQNFANNILNKKYITSHVDAALDVKTMVFRRDSQVLLYVINEGTTNYPSMEINLNDAQFSGSITNTYWTNDSAIEGTTSNQNPSQSSFVAAIDGSSINSFIFNVTDNACTQSNHSRFYQVNANAWTNGSDIETNEGDRLALGPWPNVSNGWRWEGPDGFISQSRQIVLTNLTGQKSGAYVGSYINADNCPSSVTYNVNVVCDGVNLRAYSQVNSSAWSGNTALSVAVGGNVKLGPHPNQNTGWSWTGPNGFSSTSREINLTGINANQFGDYVATFRSTSGCESSVTHTISQP